MEINDIVCIGIVIILVIGFILFIAYITIDAEEDYNNLCTKICERKSYKLIEEWGTNYECKCLDINGNIKYFEKE